MGPNDILTVSIVSAKSLQFDAAVTPDGRLIIPEVGIVNLKGKTLTEAENIVQEAIRKTFKSNEVYVALKKLREFKVTVSGSVQKPAIVSATAADRVSEVIDKVGGAKFDASVRCIKIKRDGKSLTVDLLKYYLIGDKGSNPTVLGGDNIYVPPSSYNHFIELVGEVSSPGRFEFVEGDSLSTLIRFGQGFMSSSFLDSVEIVRFVGSESNVRRWFVNLSQWKKLINVSNDLPGDFPLEVGDRVFIRQIPDWHHDKYVAIAGEVFFPGKYAINENECHVSQLINWAGGLKSTGSLDAAVLIRQSEYLNQDVEMFRLSRIPPSEMSKNERRFYDSRVAERKGVMSIDFNKIIKNPNSEDNIILQNMDSIYIPREKYFINVQGRVNNPGLVVYKEGLTYLDYVEASGGYGFRADKSETFVVKSKGQQFRAKDMNYTLEPGDYILVPPEPEITFFDVFTTTLTITTQIVTILGVVFALVRFK
jgi:protein involved in polysaccharide export with SLBB domain